jgi:hypothetical protein
MAVGSQGPRGCPDGCAQLLQAELGVGSEHRFELAHDLSPSAARRDVPLLNAADQTLNKRVDEIMFQGAEDLRSR